MKTASQVARLLEVSARCVQRHAASNNIGKYYGINRLFSQADVSALRRLVAAARSRRGFQPGNSFGRPKKQAS